MLDIADLYRDTITIPCAFKAAREADQCNQGVERLARRTTGETLSKQKVIPAMIDRIKELFDPVEADSSEH